MFSKIAEALQFFREHDWRTILIHLSRREAHPLIQFIKYGICGVGSLIIGQSLWLVLSIWLFPALDSDLPKAVRALHSTYNNIIAFFFGNLFAYATNALWVFTPGRHHRILEFFYFTLASTLGLVIGLSVGPLLIQMYGIHTVTAQLSMVFSSVMVNYACRKFFIFKG